MKPYVIVSCAISLDGFLDDTSDQRLLLSSTRDFDEVDELRSSVDAILVGANTIRRDNCKLGVRSSARRDDRMAKGLPPSPDKVTMTISGDLDPKAAFFTTEDSQKYIYCPVGTAESIRGRLFTASAVVVDVSGLEEMLHDLTNRGIDRLLVEGGAHTLQAFFAGELVDELRLAIAPIFVGNNGGAKLIGAPGPPWNVTGCHLAGNTTVLHLLRNEHQR